MPELNVKIPFGEIKRVALVYAKNGVAESIDSVYSRTGCNYAINGGAFNLATKKPESWAVCESDIRGTSYAGYGVAFREDAPPLWAYCNNVKAPHFLGSYLDYYDGELRTSAQTDNAKRGRTGIGLTEDSLFLRVITEDSPARCSVPDFVRGMAERGCTHAINLDGGLSSQFVAEGDMHKTDRLCPYYLCVWLKTPPPMYKVQFGAFRIKQYANNALIEARENGYPGAFIQEGREY